MGKIDVLVGINLLREGLDIPEVSLVAILDADKEGFLRNRRSFIQTMGRAARNARRRGHHVCRRRDRFDAQKPSRRRSAPSRDSGWHINEEHGIVPKTRPARPLATFRALFPRQRRRSAIRRAIVMAREAMAPSRALPGLMPMRVQRVRLRPSLLPPSSRRSFLAKN